MTKTFLTTSAAALLSALATPHGSAATISFAGSVSNTTSSSGQVSDWRTTTTLKTLDADGDNVYGTAARVNWTVAGINQGSFWTFVSGATQSNTSNLTFDPVTGALDPNTNAGVVSNASGSGSGWTFGIVNAQANTVRVGFAYDFAASLSGYDAATAHTLTLTQTVGGVATASTVAVLDGTADFYFFDISGINAGDRFSITDNVTNSTRTYIGATTFDVVPEPSSLGLASLGALGLLARRRRA